jgi:ABC-type transport system involved in cytochrome bd biosynthesis fused ATPase/permease subunit
MVLLLDEPDSGLDARSRAIIDSILADERLTVLMATQSLDRVLQMDQAWYLEDGRLVDSGPPVELLARNQAAMAVFGGKGLRIDERDPEKRA